MTMIRQATLFLAVTSFACARGAGTAPVAEPVRAPTQPVRAAAVALAYAPQAAPLTYLVADSGSVRMDIPGMGPMDVVFDLNTTSQLTLTRAGGDLAASVTITALKGQMSNPQAGTTAVDNTMIPRDAGRLTITPAGAITQAALPALGRTLQDVTTASTLFRWAFVRLPHSPVEPGATWVDTVEISDQLGTLTLTQRQELVSVYVGDTVIAGRKLARIEAKLTGTSSAAGSTGGMQIEQRTVGQGVQRVLWDAARGALVERQVESNATGTMTIAGANIGDIPITQRSRSISRLKEGS